MMRLAGLFGWRDSREAIATMARPLRPQLAGLIYHVMGRGNNKMAIYLDDLDRSRFLSILGGVTDKYEVDCWTSCLMPNHFHLILRTRKANISAAARQLNGVYAQWWNKRHGRVGHVFQGRFKGQIIEDGTYLLRACRYVMLNPVRARLCASPDQWPWGSYRALVGLTPNPSYLDTESLLHRLGGGHIADLRSRLIEYVNDRSDEAMARFFREDTRVIGSEEFAAQFQPKASKASPEIPARERRIGTPTLARILANALEEAEGLPSGIVRAHRDYDYPVEDIARCAGLSPKTVMKVLRSHLPGAIVTAVEWA
jgi:putative transposase